jgi:hypothetical protein
VCNAEHFVTVPEGPRRVARAVRPWKPSADYLVNPGGAALRPEFQSRSGEWQKGNDVDDEGDKQGEIEENTDRASGTRAFFRATQLQPQQLPRE